MRQSLIQSIQVAIEMFPLLEILATLFFHAFFAVVYRYSFDFWENVIHGKLDADKVPGLASFITAAVHGALIVPWSAKYLFYSDFSWTTFDMPNTLSQTLAVCLSMGYFCAVSWEWV